MKKLLIYICFTAALFATGCTKDFDEINTDPTRSSPNNFDPNFFLPSSQWEYVNSISGYTGAILFQSGWVQLFASTSSGAANYYSNADKYVQSTNTNDYFGRSWNTGFRSASLAQEIVSLTSDNPNLVNLTNIAIIMKVLNAQNLTDRYGDIPYSQALQAKSNVTLPVYDRQEDVYRAMLSDLDAALSKLDPSKPGPTADLFYGGDVEQWKRFGYSLMLRIAMRLVKADAGTAKTYAEKAASGGTMESVADDAYVKSDEANGYRNPNAAALNVVGDLYEVRWSKTFIDYLKANNDPRLSVVAEVPPAGLAANQTVGLVGDNSPINQIGMPNGYDLNGGTTDIRNAPDYPGGTGTGADAAPIGKYSRPRNIVYGNYSGPVFVLTYAESELLLAEAAVRGWNVGGGTAAQHYANGVAAGLQSLAAFGSAGMIDATTANAYAAAHPLDASSMENAIKMINEQYWATTGAQMNFVEAWNNWKRTGYPVLQNVNYPGSFSGGVIPRRQPYPTTEATLNGANYTDAVSRLTGGDTWTARVWWDK